MSSGASSEVVAEDVGLEEVIDFLASLQTSQWERDASQFDNQPDDQKFAIVPLSSSIGTFFAYTKACDELYHRRVSGKFTKEAIYGALEGVITDHAHWIETDYVFVLPWQQYEGSVLERYLLEAYDPFGDDMNEEERESKVSELRKDLESAIKMCDKATISSTLNLEETDRGKTVLIPVNSEFALLTFSRLFLQDAVSFKVDYNNMENLKLLSCTMPGFGVYYGNFEDFRRGICKHLSNALVHGEKSLVRLVENGARLESSIVSLFLSDRSLFPSGKSEVLLPGVKDLIPKHRRDIICEEEGEDGIPCYRITYSTFDKIAAIYRLLTKREQLEPVLAKIEDTLKRQRAQQKHNVSFEYMVEQKDPMAHLYATISD